MTAILPKQTWRILGFTAVLFLILTVTAIGLISAGVFDPKPVGNLIDELPLQPITVEATQQSFTWLDYEITAESFSLRLTAAHQSGDLDSGYGLALGGDTEALLVALSPTGYLAIQEHQLQAGQTVGTTLDDSLNELDNMIANGPANNERQAAVTSLMEWQPWPHVKGGTETNEIWLDKRGDEITVQINREYLYNGPITFSPNQIGLWTAAFNQSATTNFQTLTIFAD